MRFRASRKRELRDHEAMGVGRFKARRSAPRIRVEFFASSVVSGACRGAIFSVALLIGGGASGEPVRELPPANLPVYELGDTFIYSDGRVETVVSVDGERITWSNNQGLRYTSWRNFILPRLSWDGEATSGKRRVGAPPDALWPLRVGSSLSFRSTATVAQIDDGASDTISNDWKCRVSGAKTVEVAAGTFDTFQVSCDRHARFGAFLQERIWYYAPVLGHYVLRIDNFSREDSRRVETLAVRPGLRALSESARGEVEESFQTALETQLSGSATVWRDGETGMAVRVRPVATFRLSSGAYCRRFVQEINSGAQDRTFAGIVCRDATGNWRPPQR